MQISSLVFFLLPLLSTSFTFTGAPLRGSSALSAEKKIGQKLAYVPCIPLKKLPKPGTATR